MAVFRDVLAVCELRDIRFTSFPYKYDNHQQGDRNVRVRLDRVCADDEWMARFQNAGLQHLTSSRSDHCPLLLRLQQPDQRPRSKPLLDWLDFSPANVAPGTRFPCAGFGLRTPSAKMGRAGGIRCPEVGTGLFFRRRRKKNRLRRPFWGRGWRCS